MKSLFKSLRSRFIICIFFAGILPVILFHVIVVSTYENRLVHERSIEIKQRCNMIASNLSSHNTVKESLSPEMIRILTWYSDAYGGRLLLIDTDYRVLFDTFSVDTGKTCISDSVFSAFQGNEYESYKSDTGYLEFVTPIQYSDGEKVSVIAALVLSSSTDWIQKSLRNVKNGMILLEIILGIVLLIFAFLYSSRLMKPFHKVSSDLLRTGGGDIRADNDGEKLYSEITEVLESSEKVIERYKAMEKTQAEFVSNVSHELRTPMTSIRVLADSLIGQNGLPEEVYQEFLGDISVEIDRESQIIEDLLSMAKSGQNDMLNIAETSINDLIMDVLKTVRPIAEKRRIELVYESFRKVSADVDPVKLNLAISNIVENGVKYTNDGGKVQVSLDADHEYFYLRVADNGVGIPEDSLPHVFDRFYRVDKARSRDTGGTGLGLSITKQIVLLHYGIIKCESTEGIGTVFTIRIPLKHVNH